MFGFNTLRPRQNGRHFADNILKYILLKYKSSYFDSNFTDEIVSQGSN